METPSLRTMPSNTSINWHPWYWAGSHMCTTRQEDIFEKKKEKSTAPRRRSLLFSLDSNTGDGGAIMTGLDPESIGGYSEFSSNFDGKLQMRVVRVKGSKSWSRYKNVLSFDGFRRTSAFLITSGFNNYLIWYDSLVVWDNGDWTNKWKIGGTSLIHNRKNAL